LRVPVNDKTQKQKFSLFMQYITRKSRSQINLICMEKPMLLTIVSN